MDSAESYDISFFFPFMWELNKGVKKRRKVSSTKKDYIWEKETIASNKWVVKTWEERNKTNTSPDPLRLWLIKILGWRSGTPQWDTSIENPSCSKWKCTHAFISSTEFLISSTNPRPSFYSSATGRCLYCDISTKVVQILLARTQASTWEATRLGRVAPDSTKSTGFNSTMAEWRAESDFPNVVSRYMRHVRGIEWNWVGSIEWWHKQSTGTTMKRAGIKESDNPCKEQKVKSYLTCVQVRIRIQLWQKVSSSTNSSIKNSRIPCSI